MVINSPEKILNFIIFILPIDVHRYRENESKNTCTIHYSLMYIFMNLSVKFVSAHIFAWLLNFVFWSHPNLSLRNQWQVSECIKHFITYRIDVIETNEKYARMDMMSVNIAKTNINHPETERSGNVSQMRIMSCSNRPVAMEVF